MNPTRLACASALLATFLLSACGGGGGGNTPDAKTAAVTTPTTPTDAASPGIAQPTFVALKRNVTVDGKPPLGDQDTPFEVAFTDQLVSAFGTLYSLGRPSDKTGGGTTYLVDISQDGFFRLTTLARPVKELVPGADGQLWFSASDGKVVTLDAAGQVARTVSLPAMPALIEAEGRFWMIDIAANRATLAILDGTVDSTGGYNAVKAAGDVPSGLAGATVTRIDRLALGADSKVWGLMASVNATAGTRLTELLRFDADGGVTQRIDLSAKGLDACTNLVVAGNGDLLAACRSGARPAWAKVATSSGGVTVHVVNDPDANNIYGGTLAADGRVWFRTLGGKVLALGQDGTVQAIGATQAPASLTALQAGPDGRMWLVTSSESKIPGTIEAGTVIAAQAPNDDFANAAVLTGTFGTVGASSTRASAQAGEPAHAGHAAGHSLWWRWTAPKDGTLALNTYGSAPASAVAVYAGSALADLTALTDLAQPRVTLPVVAGETYLIAVDAFGTAGGYALMSYAFQE